MFDVTAIGEILIDFTMSRPEGGPPLFTPNPGGAPANVACALAKWGHKSAFAGKVGPDAFGALCRDALQSAGVDTSGLLVSGGEPTTLAFVHLDETGNRSFSFYRHGMADVSLRADEIPAPLLEKTRILHFGSVSLTEEPARSATISAVQAAKKSGAMISFDPNLRPPLWDSLETAKQEILSLIPLADILKISDDEAEFLFGKQDCRQLALQIAGRYGTRLVLISRGPAGCVAAAGGRDYTSLAYDLHTIDTTGSGDSFLAGVMHCILCREGGLAAMDEREIGAMLDFANAVGSLVSTKKGAIPALPTEEEALACMEKEPRLITA